MAGGGRKQQAGLALWPPEQLEERTGRQAFLRRSSRVVLLNPYPRGGAATVLTNGGTLLRRVFTEKFTEW